MPVLELHNLWRQIQMFLDILEFIEETKKSYLETNCFGNMVSDLNGLNCKSSNTLNFFFVKCGLSWGAFWPFRILWHILRMFLDILEFQVENKK